MKTLAKNYYLYKVHPTSLDDFVERRFRLFCGKMYRGNDGDDFIWLAFEHNSETMKADLKKIEKDCIVSQPGVLKKTAKESTILTLNMNLNFSKIMYADKYIALLEEENARLKKRNEELEGNLKKVTDDWLLAVNKWNEAVDKIHELNIEIYNTRTV